MEEAYVRVETHKGITSIEFYHPQSNSLPAKILHDLAIAIDGNVLHGLHARTLRES